MKTRRKDFRHEVWQGRTEKNYFAWSLSLISLHKNIKDMSVRHLVEIWEDIPPVSVKLAEILEATPSGYHGIPPRQIFSVSQQDYMTQTKCHLNVMEIPQASANSE